MKEDLHVRRYVETDDRDLSRLIREVFGENVDQQFLEWKYRKSPGGQALSVVAEKDGRVIGQVGAIPVRFCVDGKEFIGSQEIDGCLDKKEGKFDTLYHLVRLRHKVNEECGVAFSYFFSVPVSSKIAVKLLKGIKVSSHPGLIKVLDVAPFLLKRFPVKAVVRLLSLLVNPLLRILYTTRGRMPSGTRISRIERFDERFDAFWDRIKGDYPIMAVRDSRYLGWRYADVPYRDYTILCLEKEESGEILGFVVLGEKERDMRVGQILDVVTPRSENQGVTRALLARAMAHFYERKTALVICWMMSHCHVYPALMRLGFRVWEKEGKDLIFQNTDMDNPAIPLELAADEKNWYVGIGDSDFY